MKESARSILEAYDVLIQRRTVLKEMLRRLSSVTEKDAIEVLCFSRKLPHAEGATPLHGSSPEEYVSGFQEAFWRRHQKELDVCMNEYHSLDMRISLIESAVASLPERYASLIDGLYFKHLTWDAVEGELHISRHTISQWRKIALNLLERVWERYASMLLLGEELVPPAREPLE